jgi:hypothetical protein
MTKQGAKPIIRNDFYSRATILTLVSPYKESP